MTASENEDFLTASEVSDNSADEATDTASAAPIFTKQNMIKRVSRNLYSCGA